MLKIGDKVLIRNDLLEDKRYGNNDVVDYMLHYCGKQATITGYAHDYRIDLDNGSYHWTEEMFQTLSTTTPLELYSNILL